jgi:hypothetical protein
MVYGLPITIISTLLIFTIIILDLIGKSKKDARFYHKGTIIGTIGVVSAIVYTLLSSAYRLYLIYQ